MSTRTGELAPQQRSQPGRVPVGGPAAPARAERRNPAPAAAGRSAVKASGNGDRGLLEALLSSKVFLDYERAFTEATGLPVALRGVESWQLPHHGKQNEGPFCALMAERSRSCGSCLEVQEKLTQAATNGPSTGVCPAGLSDTVVPVRLGDRLIGYLQTGQVFRKPPTQQQFERTARLLAEVGYRMDRSALRQAYFATQVVPAKQYEAVIKLLSLFAQHLSILGNQILVRHDNAEPPIITRAKAFIQEHQTESLHPRPGRQGGQQQPFLFLQDVQEGHGP